MDISFTFKPRDRADWRAWLEQHHAGKTEIWLVSDAGQPAISYLDSVEEALCFGWIDGIVKRLSPTQRAQRFTPRRPKSNWTELNKARVRRLIELGLMTPAGLTVVPDLTAPLVVAKDIMAALEQVKGSLEFFEGCPELYRCVRASYVEEQRKQPSEFEKRLAKLVARCAARKMFGNTNDGGRLEPRHARPPRAPRPRVRRGMVSGKARALRSAPIRLSYSLGEAALQPFSSCTKCKLVATIPSRK